MPWPDESMNILEQNDYYPFGMRHVNAQMMVSNNRFRYNGKEEQQIGGLDVLDYGARMYDPAIGRFHTQDRFSEDFVEWSPYHYANNNPITNIDVNGDSTFVTTNDDGAWDVQDVRTDGSEKGIYLVNDDGTYTDVGETVTSHSFMNDDGEPVKGAVISYNTDGQEFIDNLIEENPSLPNYMLNARNGEKYDFKVKGINDRPEGMSEEQYMYRGSVTKDGEIGSARDFGNMGAGIVAGRKGLTWGEARAGFDAYQSYKSGKLTTEGITTQKAEAVGYIKGVQIKLNSTWYLPKGF